MKILFLIANLAIIAFVLPFSFIDFDLPQSSFIDIESIDTYSIVLPVLVNTLIFIYFRKVKRVWLYAITFVVLDYVILFLLFAYIAVHMYGNILSGPNPNDLIIINND